MTVNEGITNKIETKLMKSGANKRKKKKKTRARNSHSALKAKRLLLLLFDLNYWSRHCFRWERVYVSAAILFKNIWSVRLFLFLFFFQVCVFTKPYYLLLLLLIHFYFFAYVKAGNKEESQPKRSQNAKHKEHQTTNSKTNKSSDSIYLIFFLSFIRWFAPSSITRDVIRSHSSFSVWSYSMSLYSWFPWNLLSFWYCVSFAFTY